MPAASLKQLKYFKLIKAYKEGGIKQLYLVWKQLFGTRPFPEAAYIDIIKAKAAKMKDAHLEDLTSGLKGDNNLGDSRDIKVGYFMLFKGSFRGDNKEIKSGTFIGKISKVDNEAKLAKINSNEIYNRFGVRTVPLHRASVVDPQFQYLDFAY